MLAITRDEIIANAWNYTNLHWSCADYNSTRWQNYYEIYGCSLHLMCDFEPDQVYVGEAYGYGQNDAYGEFNDKIDDSLAAGNHQCHYENYFNSTAIAPPDWATGIDCSAFVCRCWEVSRTNTGGLYEKYHPVAKNDVQPGDILVKPASHTVLVCNPGENPPNGSFSLFEASGSKAVVWYNPNGQWSDYADYAARSLFPTGVSEKTEITPGAGGFVPNPFADRATIKLTVPGASDNIRINIFDVRGQKVKSELSRVKNGFLEYSWNGYNQSLHPLPTGVYFCRIEIGGSVRLEKVILIRYNTNY
jgi:hypothetical protein